MTLERRFGIALFVLALGNGMLALGNAVNDAETSLIGFQVFMALVVAGLGYSFAYGDSELTVGESRERLIAYATMLIAAVGVVLALMGFAIAVAL